MLALGVEGRLVDVAQPVRDGERLVLVERVDVDAPEEGRRDEGVGDPLGIGAPGRAHRRLAAGDVERLGGDPLHGPGLDVEPEERERVVGEGDLGAVGRPVRRAVEARAAELELLHVAAAVLGPDVEGVFAGFVGEIGDGLPVGRPGRIALVDARSHRQVAGIALLGRDGDDLAPELEDGPRAGRRHAVGEDPLGALDVAFAELGQVGGDADDEPAGSALGDIVEVERAGLLEDDLAGPGRGREDREVLELGQLVDLLRRGIEGEQVELAVAVGAEDDLAADPHRVDVVRPARGLGQLLDALIPGVEDPDAGETAAAVVLPLVECFGKRAVGDVPAVGGDLGVGGVGHFEHAGLAARDGHGEELGIGAVAGETGRGEQHRLAVRREAQDDVGRRVPGQALGDAAAGRDDVGVEIAVVLAAERDEPAVGREGGIGLRPDVRGQAADVAAFEVGRPKVVGVDEGDALGRDGRPGQHLRVVGIDGPQAGRGAQAEDQGEGEDEAGVSQGMASWSKDV